MTYRKFSATYLFTGREMAAGNSVLVTTTEGKVQAIIPATEAGDGVETLNGILSPGFVNCHCHLELSHMKGLLPEKAGLVDFLLAVMQGRTSAPVHIRSAIADAEQAMLDEGIVAVGDICNTTDTLPQKQAGRLYYHNFIETMGFIEARAPDRFEYSRAILDAFADAFSQAAALSAKTGAPPYPGHRGPNSLVPHAPYSVSGRLFGLIAELPGNRLLTIHNQECEAENEFYLDGKGDFLRLYQAMGLDVSFFSGTGKRSLESYLPYFHEGQSLVLVHNVATNEEDMRYIRNGNGRISGGRSALGAPGRGGPGRLAGAPALSFCLCPNANLYIGGILPDPDLLMKHGCRIVIGTDSLASNHQLSVLEELKTLQRRFSHLSTATLLQWATYNGAAALEVENTLGSFAAGSRPGVVLIEGVEEGRFTGTAKSRRIL